ncbi:diguanylate cyclase (GGDEF)-like protein, partial [Oxalobacteraceae bacterium GrIS 1.18]
MNKMTPDRRCSNNADRRKSDGISLMNEIGNLSAPTEELPFARYQTFSTHERSMVARESALSIREEAIGERENDLRRRENLLAILQGKSAALRIQEISDAQIARAMQDYRQSKLKEANEHLVIASVQCQNSADEIELSKKALTHLANHDFLTNLPNRLQLYDRITHAIAFAKRHHEKLAVLFLDLDRFKSINDRFGHAVGDQLLQAVAQRLNNAIRSSDTVSRQGGDEFVMVLSEVNDKPTLARNVKKIHTIITAPYTIEGNELHIGATIGISMFPQDGH